MHYRKEVREMRLKNKRMYELTGEAGAAQGTLYEEAMKDDEVQIGVQVNGKARGVVTIPADASKDVALAAAKEAVADKITGTIVKEIYVPGKIINIVCK